MRIAETLLPEFEHEMASTRKTIARIPDDKLTWRAHPKSQTIGWVASHLVEIVDWAVGTLQEDSFDVQPVGAEPYQTPVLNSVDELLTLFDANLAKAKAALLATSDEAMLQPWSLLQGGAPIFTMPRIAVLRGFVISHSIHHRAILTVYFRLNDIPVPALYGPSGDEME